MHRGNFENRKAEIQQETEAMLQCIQKMLDTAIECLQVDDAQQLQETLQRARDLDHEVNNYEEGIYHHCIQLISLEQPVASDLRFSIGVLKFIGDLERIGDHCVHLVKIACRNTRLEVRTAVPQGLIAMARSINQIYQSCHAAITQLDAEQAKDIIAADERLDDVHKQFVTENAQMLHSSPQLSDSFVNFMFLSRFIERIGDHISNVCEWLIFMREGTRPS